MEKILYTGDEKTLENICSNCRMCELMCSVTNCNQVNPSRSRIRLIHIDLEEAMPVACLQCEDAPCLLLCPVNAIEEIENRYLSIDENKCIGCGICVLACPIGAISIDQVKGIASKCDLCKGDPQCVKYCSPGVLKKGCASDLASLKGRRFIKHLMDAIHEAKEGKESAE
jgi:Fe-S-cluster-containing hydrogenase component 2